MKYQILFSAENKKIFKMPPIEIFTQRAKRLTTDINVIYII